MRPDLPRLMYDMVFVDDILKMAVWCGAMWKVKELSGVYTLQYVASARARKEKSLECGGRCSPPMVPGGLAGECDSKSEDRPGSAGLPCYCCKRTSRITVSGS